MLDCGAAPASPGAGLKRSAKLTPAHTCQHRGSAPAVWFFDRTCTLHRSHHAQLSTGNVAVNCTWQANMSESFAALLKNSQRTGNASRRSHHRQSCVNTARRGQRQASKSEAYVPLEEFKNDKGEVEVQVGDFVSVAIGSIEKRLRQTPSCRATPPNAWLRGWSLEKALESGEFVTGTTSGKGRAA